jgi:hypothetical protein
MPFAPAREDIMKRIAAIGALTTFALLNCNDSNRTPAEPSSPIQPSAPNVRSTRTSAASDHKIKLPQLSAAALAEAEKADLATAEMTTTTTTTDFADHDPTVLGMTVRCVDGHTFGYPPGDADPFRPQNSTTRGCELTTMAGGAAIVQPSSNSTRGKLVRNTVKLEFYYAGGPQLGGAPRFTLFTDYCRDASGNPVTTMNTPCNTDGTWDETLFIDQSTCNDGDPYVGAVLLKSVPNSKSNPNCPVNETYGFDGVAATGDEHVHANWFAYIGAHPKDRFARNTGDLTGTENDFLRLDNFIIADVPVHFLIYRVRMQGGTT